MPDRAWSGRGRSRPSPAAAWRGVERRPGSTLRTEASVAEAPALAVQRQALRIVENHRHQAAADERVVEDEDLECSGSFGRSPP